MQRWYKIDNAGKIFHAVKKATNSSVFRVSMLLHEEVEHEKLQEAVDIVLKRFPTLAVRLHKGVFWDFMEGNENRLVTEQETDYPCQPIDPSSNNGYLMRVLYYKRRISVEMFHSLTDGSGAVEFLKSLVYQYLSLKGKNVEAEGKVMLPGELPSRYETEDSYEKHYKKIEGNKKKGARAFHIEGTPFEHPGNNVIHGVLDSTAVKTAAKQHGTTITGFLTTILINAIYLEATRYGNNEDPVKIAIPVNLRRLFPSKTIRNFFGIVNIGMFVSENMPFQTVLQEISTQLKRKTEKQHLYEQIYDNMKRQKMLSARFIPVWIKHIAMRYGFKHLGEQLKTMTLSNLGHIQLPTAMNEQVDRMELVMYPTDNSPINCGICSVNDQLTITFSRSIIETDIIKSFFRYLTQTIGLEVKVYSNNWGINGETM
ncbi:alcohol acetyltransferase [Salibacterium aidingense]|uniref:alcohol acetyltransferase n=1 Tax=Salibacterium aidingense TaxID=384933 RepID=UPI0003F9B461|nr:alcohol acetyltransferase [Salibacterium aidingense]